VGRRQEKPDDDLREIRTRTTTLLQTWHTGQLQTQRKITLQILTGDSTKEQEIPRELIRIKLTLLRYEIRYYYFYIVIIIITLRQAMHAIS